MGIQQMIMAAGGLDEYLVANSLRFNSGDSAYLSWTPSSAGNRETWTWSSWVKRGKIDATRRTLIRTNTTETHISFAETAQGNAEALIVYGVGAYLVSTPVYNDASDWYHIVLAWDTTQATSTDRIKVYVNGVQITSWSNANAAYPSRYADSGINAASAHGLGANSAGGELHDGYLADVHFVDGTALDASSFGETVDSLWVPKEYSGSHGTNGYHLKFNNTSDLGEDSSGNGNDWTANSFSTSAGAGNDVLADSPTAYDDGGNGVGNYATLLDKYVTVKTRLTVSNGNLDVEFHNSNSSSSALSSIAVSSGKWYCEFTASQTGNHYAYVGIASTSITNVDSLGYGDSYGYLNSNGNKVSNGSSSSYGATWTSGDVIGVALDMDTGTLVFYKNNSSQGTAYTSISGTYIIGCTGFDNWKFTSNFGQRAFAYTPPTGYKALNSYNT